MYMYNVKNDIFEHSKLGSFSEHIIKYVRIQKRKKYEKKKVLAISDVFLGKYLKRLIIL